MHTQIKNILVLFLAICLVYTLRANDGKNPSPLQGYVMDAVTKKPVSGVLVYAKAQSAAISKEAITDEEGYFSFEQLPANLFNLEFDKKGYQPIRKTGIVIKEKTPTRVSIEFCQEESLENKDDSEYPLLRMLQIN